MRGSVGQSAFVAAAAMAGLLAGSAGGGGCGMDAVGSAPSAQRDAGPSEGEQQPPDSGPCAAPRVACGADCADLQSAHDHCGSCARACAPSEACAAGDCQSLCPAGTSTCAGACVDVAADPANCGGCGKACGQGELCSTGQCRSTCGGGLAPCSGKCVNTTTDGRNCGACGHTCGFNEACVGGGCKAVCALLWRPTDAFGATMFGCAGRVAWPDRANGCAPGLHVCSASEWVARRAGASPTFNYWTNDALRYRGSSSSCAATVSTSSSTSCPTSTPMRVCAGPFDLLGNTCNWLDCGLDTPAPNQRFGGCVGNSTAGVLCCTP